MSSEGGGRANSDGNNRNRNRGGGSGRSAPGGRGGGRGRGRGRGRSAGRGRGRGDADATGNAEGGRQGRGNNTGRGGRGRGRNNNNNNDNAGRNAPQQQQQPSRQPPPQQQPTGPKLQNGEKGADIHTVSEADRIRYTQQLIELRERHWEVGEETPNLEFPPTLTNTERKFIHSLAGQLGLTSKSTGKGDKRRITVYPSKRNTKKLADDDSDDLKSIPKLEVGTRGVKALQQHFQQFPQTRLEELESRETGSSLVEAAGNSDGAGKDAAMAQALSQMGLLHDRKDNRKYRHKAKPIDLERRQKHHAAAQQQKQSRAKEYQDMLDMRSQLPAYKHQKEIVQMVNQNQVTIISGDTGCGKSTQVPQFLVDALPTCNIAVTQPRRIAAISIAERVADEQLQNSTGGQIGYQVRLESSQSEATQVLFMTPGVLLRQLQTDPFLLDYTHILLDEVHERDQYQEFLLVVLRDLLPRRPDLRLVLMSATLQTEKLVEYFLETKPAFIEMEGRMYPVQEFFLEHILDMTGYIQVTMDDDGDAGEAIALQTMTDDQLEAELARFTNGEIQPQQQSQQQSTKVHPRLKCVLCRRRNFKDAVELGTHIATCTGAYESEEEGDDDANPGGDDMHNKVSFGGSGNANNPQGATEDLLQGVEFEEYDVDEEVELEDYDEFDFEAHADNASDGEEDTPEENGDGATGTEKWDGVSAFGKTDKTDASLTEEEQILVTKKEDAILSQYQAMHDDELIDTYLLLETVQYINQSSYGDGSILIFLDSWQSISEIILLLESTPPFSNRDKFLILPLHSGIPSKDQRKVLRPPPSGMRKIICSTPIAETSLTINDVSFVIDTGRCKEKSYDPHLKTSTLQSTWISQASAKQRKGRAGRTKRGVCFHLFSQRRLLSMRPFVESELLRTPLEEMCLLCKKLGLAPGGAEDDDGIPAFLAKAMSAPHARSIANALDLLLDLGAIYPETNNLTDLGECLAILSLEPRVGKMVIWSYLLGCARVASNMAVAMSYKSPFTLPPTHQRKAADTAKVQLSQRSESDQVTVHYALETRDQLQKGNRGGSSNAAFNTFCRKNFLSSQTLHMISDIRKNLTRELASIGFPSPTSKQNPTTDGKNSSNKGGAQSLAYHNRHDNDHPLWQATIAAGLYPNVAVRKNGEVNFSTMTNQKAKVHISSVNAVKGQPLNSKCEIPNGQVEFVCFGEMVKGSAQFFTVNQTTRLESPLPLLLLCGTRLSVRPVREAEEEEEEESKGKSSRSRRDQQKRAAILTLDDWIVFHCDADVAAHIVVLRKRLDSAFWRAIANPTGGSKKRPTSNDNNNKSKDLLSNLTDIQRGAVEIVGAILQSAHVQSESAKKTSNGPPRRK